MATMNVSVPDPMQEWVQQRVDSGHYASASDYVSALIRQDQVSTDERNALLGKLIEGEESGASGRTVLDIVAAAKSAG